jgi:hypothetical protein
MYGDDAGWAACAAILALGAAGLWACFLMEGIEMLSHAQPTKAMRMRVAGSGVGFMLLIAAALLCWVNRADAAVFAPQEPPVERV